MAETTIIRFDERQRIDVSIANRDIPLLRCGNVSEVRGQVTAVAVVGDQPLFVGALAEAIERAADLAVDGIWSDYGDALADWCVQRAPDVAVVDLHLFEPDPITALQHLQAGLGVPVVCFCRDMHVDLLHLLLASGARGAIDTRADGDAVRDALRKIATHEHHIPSEWQQPLADRFFAGDRPSLLLLSPRERQVLLHAASGPPVDEIARSLVLSTTTVRTHLSSAYRKLNVRNRAEAVRELARFGMLSHLPRRLPRTDPPAVPMVLGVPLSA